MALSLYNSTTGAFAANTGGTVSPSDLQLNILIEMRTANLLALELAQGNVNVSLPALRLDVVNDS